MENTNTTSFALKLAAVALGMFGFGFAMVPLYDVICDITGLNGKTGDQVVASEDAIDTSREIKVQFIANNNAGMSWEFRPTVRTMTVHPGASYRTDFFARNPTGRLMTAQAVPSVTPYYASRYLHKTECFCFEQQQLATGESIDMPLHFVVDRDVPEDVTTLTLAYTLFDVTEQVDVAQARLNGLN